MIAQGKKSNVYKISFIITKILEDMKKYGEYIKYAVKSELKAQLSSTHLGCLWWVLDPLMYMLVYILVVSVILNKGKENFPIFVFCAVLSWKWTSSSLLDSTKVIKSRARLLQQIYLPKFILVFIKVLTNTIKFLVGICVLLLLILMFGIQLTPHIIEFFFVFSVNFILVLGISCFLAHLGVYFKDINNIMAFSLRLWFYVSPAIYSVSDVPKSIRWIWHLNPMSAIYAGYRDVFLYGRSPTYSILCIWLVISLSITFLGAACLSKYDKKYIKVV